MKKVWILERYYTPEECLETANNLKEIIEQIKSEGNVVEEEIHKIEESVKNLKELYSNRKGKWVGFEGKCNYEAFIQVAKEAMLRNKNVEFRVVEGEINDNSTYWKGYKVKRINVRVMKYLRYAIK